MSEPRHDTDDVGCFNAGASLLVEIGGCIGLDQDFDGTSYQPVWPGTLSNAAQDQALHAESFLFTSPLSHGRNYERAAFETDLPAIEFATGCDTTTGDGCVNPPPGADFYPIYSTTGTTGCGWREGGIHMPGTTNSFGGTSTAEYGPSSRSSTRTSRVPGDGAVLRGFSQHLAEQPMPEHRQLAELTVGGSRGGGRAAPRPRPGRVRRDILLLPSADNTTWLPIAIDS